MMVIVLVVGVHLGHFPDIKLVNSMTYIHSFLPSFIHSFIQKTLTESLTCARYQTLGTKPGTKHRVPAVTEFTL